MHYVLLFKVYEKRTNSIGTNGHWGRVPQKGSGSRKELRDVISHCLFWGLLIKGIGFVLILGDGISSKVSDLRLGILKC